MKYVLLDLSTRKTMLVDLDFIIEEINRDRSDEWTNYNKSDWREGWDEWCEGDVYSLLHVVEEKDISLQLTFSSEDIKKIIELKANNTDESGILEHIVNQYVEKIS